LSKRTSSANASSSRLDLPSVPPPPDASALSSRASLATHVSHLRSRAVWARSVASQAQEINARIDQLNHEITVLQTSAKIALVNLGNVSRRVQRAFTDAESLAEKKLELRRTLLERIPGAVTALEKVEIHPIFGRKEESLGELFEKDDVLKAREICSRTNEDVDRRVGELKNTMEEFILQGEALKKEVLAWQPETMEEGGQVREVSLIADKIERGMCPLRDFTELTCRLHAYIRDDESSYRDVILDKILSKSYSRIHPQHSNCHGHPSPDLKIRPLSSILRETKVAFVFTKIIHGARENGLDRPTVGRSGYDAQRLGTRFRRSTGHRGAREGVRGGATGGVPSGIMEATTSEEN